MTTWRSAKTSMHTSETLRTLSSNTLLHQALSMVTPLGWGIITIMVIAGVGLALVGWAELLVFLLASLIMISTGLIMSMGNLGCRADLNLGQIRLVVGQESELSVTLSNPGPRTAHRCRISIMIGSEPAYLAFPALAAGQSDHLNLRLQASHRGAVHVGPVTMEAGDPYGAILRKRILTDGNQLYVHPRTIDLAPITAGLQRDLDGRAASGIVDDDLEFHALRPYQPGDDIKRVHWLSTAKTGSLMVRQYEPTLRTTTALWMDTDPSSYASAEEFELAVSIFASLGERCLLDNRRLAAMVPADQTRNRVDAPAGFRPNRLRQNHSAWETSFLRTDSPRTFLDDCSSIFPVEAPAGEKPGQSSAPWLGMLETHVPDTSLILLVSGSRTDRQATQTMTVGLPESIRTMVLIAAREEARAIHEQGAMTLARLGTLEDLPLITETLV